MEPDKHAALIEETERRLERWAKDCRENSRALGLPKISSIEALTRHVQAETKKRKAMRKGVRREALTAQGKQKRVFKTPTISVNSEVMSVDAAIAVLPFWGREAIKASFLFGLPDRLAANQLRMPLGQYSQRRRAAVERVAAILQERHNSVFPAVGRPAAP